MATTHGPVLSSQSVSPATGDRSTPYLYQVTFSDIDNTAPAAISLYINGQQVPSTDIKRQDVNPFSSGTVYAYTRPAGSLAVGTHTYYWEASDGATTVRLPAAGLGTLTGPVVGNVAPTLVPVAVSPPAGRASTEYVYQVTYADADNDPPAGGSVTLMLDGQPVQMQAQDATDRLSAT